MNPAVIHRFSSRRQRLDHPFLAHKLAGAKSYRRIAGYSRSSIFEPVGEEIAGIERAQIVCNSELDPADDVGVLSRRTRDQIELRYRGTIDPDRNRWELCSRVLCRKDVVGKLSESW